MEEIVLAVRVPHCLSFALDCALQPQEVRKGVPISAGSRPPSGLQSQHPGILPCAVCKSQLGLLTKRLIVHWHFIIC